MTHRRQHVWLAAALAGTFLAPPAFGRAAIVRNHTPEVPASTPSAAWPVHYPRRLRHAPAEAGTPEALLRRMLNLHMASRYKEALAVADELRDLAPEQPIIHYNRACVLARLHRPDAALDALDRAIALGWWNRDHLALDPDLDGLRDQPRFLAAIERAGAPPPRTDARVIDELEAFVPTLLGPAAPAFTVGLLRDGTTRWQHRFALGGSDGPARLSLSADLLLLIAAGRLGLEASGPAPRERAGDAIESAFAVLENGWRETLGRQIAARAGTTLEDYCRDHILAPISKGLRLVPVGAGGGGDDSVGSARSGAGVASFRVTGTAERLGRLVALAAQEGALRLRPSPLRDESAKGGSLIHWSGEGDVAVFVLFPSGAGAAAQHIATLAVD